MNIELNLQIIISVLFVIFGCLGVMIGILTLVAQQGYKKFNYLLEKIDELSYDKKNPENKPDDKSENSPCEDKPDDKSENSPCEDKCESRKESNKYTSFIEEQWFRKLGKTATPFLTIWLGNYYWTLHSFIMMVSGTILLFDNNVYHLLILFNVTCMDALACVILHDCPLTILEKKYLKTSLMHERTKCFKYSPILYRCNHNYEKTLEFLINIVCFIFGKMSCLLILKSLDIKFAPVE